MPKNSATAATDPKWSTTACLEIMQPLQHTGLRTVKHGIRNKRQDTYVSIGERIKQRRQELGLDVPEVARLCGVSKSLVNQWESGDVKYLRPVNLMALSDALKCYVRWIVLGLGPKERMVTRDQLSQEEDKLIEHYRILDDSLKGVVTDLAKSLAEQGKEGPGPDKQQEK
jgi:transcriptional regulator with XRE-family HTH domain